MNDENDRKRRGMKRVQEQLSGLSGIELLGFEEVAGTPMRFMLKNKARFYARKYPYYPDWSRSDYVEWIRQQFADQQIGGGKYLWACGIGVGILVKVELSADLVWVAELFTIGQGFALLAPDLSWGFKFGIGEDVWVEIVDRDAEEKEW